jgi:YebC/PmpR family DNA-binding regulatory protein
MAGHSKWANIQHRKKAQDQKRGKVFTRLIREITVAARMGGEDPDSNPRLRLALDKAFSANMGKETVDRAVKRGAGTLEGVDYEEIRYEGYGPQGVAIMVDCMTDNRNRSVSEVRHAFTKYSGNFGASGSVAYLFSQKGELCFSNAVSEEQLLELAIEAGADDVIVNEDGSLDVLTSAEAFAAVKNALNEAGLEPQSAELTQIASTQVDLDQVGAEKLMRLIDVLEELDDVQAVYSNAKIADDVLKAMSES